MDTSEQPSEDDELLATNQNGPSNRRVRKKRVRLEKDEMYAIELHRRTLRIRLMIALGVLVIAAVMAGVVAWYPGTEGFRDRLDRMMLNTTGAEITPFSPPSGLATGSFNGLHTKSKFLAA